MLWLFGHARIYTFCQPINSEFAPSAKPVSDLPKVEEHCPERPPESVDIGWLQVAVHLTPVMQEFDPEQRIVEVARDLIQHLLVPSA